MRKKGREGNHLVFPKKIIFFLFCLLRRLEEGDTNAGISEIANPGKFRDPPTQTGRSKHELEFLLFSPRKKPTFSLFLGGKKVQVSTIESKWERGKGNLKLTTTISFQKSPEIDQTHKNFFYKKYKAKSPF